MRASVATSVIVYLAIIAASPGVTCAEAPRYRWQPNAQFVYQVRITADTPLETEIMSGHIVYDVVSASEPLKVKYRGGLTKTTRMKPGAATGSRGGPFARDPFGPAGGSPFARRVNPFQGLEQTTNEISLKPSGEILAVTGSSQLPYLLGNLSLLPFEPLPEADQKSWNVEGGILITEKGEQRGRANFFDPFASRGGSTQDKQSAGGQSTSFTFVSETDGLAVYERSYRLNSPADGKSLAIDGSGRWTFNRQLGMSESLDFKQTLRIKLTNVEVAIPVEIKYERLSAEAWAKLESDRLAREDALRRMAEQQTAEAKAAAEAPIVGDERTRVLAALRSTNAAALAETLGNLSKKSPRDDDELAQTIQPLLTHSDTKVQASARAALAAFSPAYKRVYDLNRAYARSYEVKDVGLWITHDTPLPAGLTVAANSFNYAETQYFPATVVQPLANGLVKVKYQDRGSFTEERLREDMFLPPPEVEQPNLTKAQLASVRAYEAEVRGSIGNSGELETLIRAYRDGKQPVPKIGEPLPAGVTLPKFLVVAAKRDNQWYQAHISGELPDGRVSVRFSGERFDAKLPRADVRLPPPEVKQPNVASPFATPTPAVVSSATTASPQFFRVLLCLPVAFPLVGCNNQRDEATMPSSFSPPGVASLTDIDLPSVSYVRESVVIQGVVSPSSQCRWAGYNDGYKVHCFSFAAWGRVGELPVTRELTILRAVPPTADCEADFPKLSIQRIRVLLSTDETRAIFENSLPMDSTDKELHAIALKLRQPVVFSTKEFGDLVLDRKLDWFRGEAEWNGELVSVTFPADGDEPSEAALHTARLLWADQENWETRIELFAVEQLLEVKNHAWLEEGEAEVTAEEFIERIAFPSISVGSNGDFDFWYDDDDMFWGHSILIRGNVKDGPTEAQLPG